MIYNIKTGTFEPNYDALDSTQLPPNCYVVTEEQINLISDSITGGGVVWVDNGVIQCSAEHLMHIMFLIQTKKNG